jgi:hypothetical protein
MRSICATLIALCLIAAGSTRAPQLETTSDRGSTTVDTAPWSAPTAVKHRRRAVVPDAGLGPLTVAVATIELAPPQHSFQLAAGPAPRTPTHAPNRPHSARGPPPG